MALSTIAPQDYIQLRNTSNRDVAFLALPGIPPAHLHEVALPTYPMIFDSRLNCTIVHLLVLQFCFLRPWREAIELIRFFEGCVLKKWQEMSQVQEVLFGVKARMSAAPDANSYKLAWECFNAQTSVLEALLGSSDLSMKAKLRRMADVTGIVATAEDHTHYYIRVFVRRYKITHENGPETPVLFCEFRHREKPARPQDLEPGGLCKYRLNSLPLPATKCVCVSLFRPVKRNARLDQYLHGLYDLSMHPLFRRGWKLRVYIDSSLKAVPEEWSVISLFLSTIQRRSEIVQTHCALFHHAEHHAEYFGSLLRFHGAFDSSLDVAAFRDIDSSITDEDASKLEDWSDAALRQGDPRELLLYFPENGYAPQHLWSSGSLLGMTQKRDNVIACGWAICKPLGQLAVWDAMLARTLRHRRFGYGIDEVSLNEDILPHLLLREKYRKVVEKNALSKKLLSYPGKIENKKVASPPVFVTQSRQPANQRSGSS